MSFLHYYLPNFFITVGLCFVLRRFFGTVYFALQVRGGFLNDADMAVPLKIMSFKSAPTSSKNASPSACSSSSSHQHEIEHDNHAEEDKEVTVHLMKEEAGRFFFPLFSFLVSRSCLLLNVCYTALGRSLVLESLACRGTLGGLFLLTLTIQRK